MPTNLKLYIVLTYILIPIALFFGLLDVLILLSALANPSALIMVFVIACLVIYTFASYKFLKKGLEKEIVQTLKLKDWIKVNAYVSLILCSLFFLNSISILISTNAVLFKFIDDFLQQQPNMPKEVTSTFVLTVLKAVSVLLLITGVVGIIHIRTTLRLVKQHAHLFE